MRLSYGLLVGFALLSSGCSVFIAQSGEDVTKLGTREQVHQDFGQPAATGMTDGAPFEEFQTQRKISEWNRACNFDIEDTMTFGLAELVAFPIELYRNEQRLRLGQTVRFKYDESGHITQVYLNGEFLVPPTNTPVTAPKIAVVNKQQ